MKKEEYYKYSEDRKLPLRCPCLSNCSRYRFTAYFIGKNSFSSKPGDVEMNMKNMRILNDSESISQMLQAGEPVTYTGGCNSFYINNACPEFFLHEHEHKLCGMGNLAVHQFTYDKNYSGSKFKPGESRHFTECPEYSVSFFKKSVAKIRKKISPKIKAELQKEIESRCPFCINEDVGHFQIHHIDQNSENNDIDNLLMLCANCHSKVT